MGQDAKQPSRSNKDLPSIAWPIKSPISKTLKRFLKIRRLFNSGNYISGKSGSYNRLYKVRRSVFMGKFTTF